MEISFLDKLPQSPGIYLFTSKEGQIIYIGKAINLRERVKAYFTLKGLGGKTKTLVSEIDKVDHIKVESEFEALLLEAALIKKIQPKYNTRLRDDKSPLYIKITTADSFPKVLTVRRENDGRSSYFGPFPSARTTREVLRFLRRIFPFCQQKKISQRACFYSHLGLCCPCPSKIQDLRTIPGIERKKFRELALAKRECVSPEILKTKANKAKEYERLKKIYRQNIFRLKRVLEGKSKQVLKNLTKEMEQVAKEENFEEAAMLRDKIEKLNYLTQERMSTSLYLANPEILEEKRGEELKELTKALKQVKPVRTVRRIEAYDVSNIQGRQATGSMVVFVNGEAEKDSYRRFRIKLGQEPNDVGMIKEVLERRFNHPEWEYPDLILIDGGKGQVSAALTTLKEKRLKIPVIGLAKRLEEVIRIENGEWKMEKLEDSSRALNLLKRIRDEAHRFALSYHRKLRLKALMT